MQGPTAQGGLGRHIHSNQLLYEKRSAWSKADENWLPTHARLMLKKDLNLNYNRIPTFAIRIVV